MVLSKLHLFLFLALSFAAGSLLTARLAKPASVDAAGARVFELRTYHTRPGGLPALQARFRDHTVAIFNRLGVTSIGYWTPQDAPASENTFIYILAHPSREAAKKSWDAFHDDPEWQKVMKDAGAAANVVEKVDSVFMEPTDFSPMK
jgi:hypothetical protein